MSFEKGEIFAFGNDAQDSLASVRASWIGAKYCSFPSGFPPKSSIIYQGIFHNVRYASLWRWSGSLVSLWRIH